MPLREWDGAEPFGTLASSMAEVFDAVRIDRVEARYRATLELRSPILPSTAARLLAEVPSVPLDGGRSLFGAILRDRTWTPLGRAYTSVRETKTNAIDTLLTNLGKYGHGLDDLPFEDDEEHDYRCPARKGGKLRGARCKRVAGHDGRHRYKGRVEAAEVFEDDVDADD